MTITLYKRQKELLEFLKQYIGKHGSSPTLREIAEAMNLNSLATVHEHLQALEKKKVIMRKGGTIRGIEINEEYTSHEHGPGVQLPLVGFIAAGSPIEAIEDNSQTIEVPSNMVDTRKRQFVLKVKGNSMIDDGILDGDFVIIEQQETARNGDIVVALLDEGQATLKRFYKEATRIRLEPANSAMAPIFAKNVQIQGRVIGLTRKYF